MPGACGFACEVCVFPDKGICPVDRCVAGTDPQAPKKLERLKSSWKRTCPILECAIDKKVDYCIRCDQFPCEIHYDRGIFNHNVLDFIKGELQK